MSKKESKYILVRVLLLFPISIISLESFFSTIGINLFGFFISKTNSIRANLETSSSNDHFFRFLISSLILLLLIFFEKLYPIISKISKVTYKNATLKIKNLTSKSVDEKFLDGIYSYLDAGNDQYMKFVEKNIRFRDKSIIDKLFDIVAGRRDKLFYEMERGNPDDLKISRYRIARFIPILLSIVDFYRTTDDKKRLHVCLAVLCYVYKDSTNIDDVDKEEKYKEGYLCIDEAIKIRNKCCREEERSINYEINRLLIAINLHDSKYKKNIAADFKAITEYDNGRDIIENMSEWIAPNLKEWISNNNL